MEDAHATAEQLHCPLCGYGFRPSHDCAAGCPMGQGCGMIKCPNCKYEFVERSKVADGLRALFSRWFKKKEPQP
jgi:hypothetical protein